MITVSRAAKSFNGKRVLREVSFEAKKGEIVGFLGPNGAGKTTTMRLILGYFSPDSGNVRVNGLDPINNRMETLRNMGYLPENNPLYPDMKVKEYLSFIASLKGEKDIGKIMEAVALEDRSESKIEELSRGYKQRVGLAAALCGNPQILILDEPTSGLDPLEQETIRKLIKKLSEKKTIIFSTHILSEVEEIADKVIIIHNGAVVFDGPKPKQAGGVSKLFKQSVRS